MVLAVLVLTLAGCGSPRPVATVDGTPIERSALDALHPSGTEVEAEQQASSLFLLILHGLLVESAAQEFDVRVEQQAQQAAFTARTGHLGDDVDAALHERGTTRDRVLLEADLDVIRAELEKQLVRTAESGVDLDAAYRSFLSTNSRVCLSVLRVSDTSALATIERLVDEGADVIAVRRAHPRAVEPIDLDCASPTQFEGGLASVAVDGDVGEAHVVQAAGGAVVAMVGTRDAPRPDDVRDELLQIAVETQGRELFNAWAGEVVRAAVVDVDRSVGRWAPAEGTGGMPTVVASSP